MCRRILQKRDDRKQGAENPPKNKNLKKDWRRRMILLVDNYDSFTYNVYQYIGSLYPQIQVVRNDEITIDEIRNLQNLEALVISPGPGYPDLSLIHI